MVTTITTVTTVGALGVSTVLSIVAVVTLILFLATREIASSGNSRFQVNITRYATIGILPLILAFGVIVLVAIINVL